MKNRDDALCDVCVQVADEFFADGERQMCVECFQEWFGDVELDINKPETVN